MGETSHPTSNSFHDIFQEYSTNSVENVSQVGQNDPLSSPLQNSTSEAFENDPVELYTPINVPSKVYSSKLIHQRSHSIADSLRSLEIAKINFLDRRFSAPGSCSPARNQFIQASSVIDPEKIAMPPFLQPVDEEEAEAEMLAANCQRGYRPNKQPTKRVSILPYIDKEYEPPLFFRRSCVRMTLIIAMAVLLILLIGYTLFLIFAVPIIVENALNNSEVLINSVKLSNCTLRGFDMDLRSELLGIGFLNLRIDPTVLYICSEIASVGRVYMAEQHIYGLFGKPELSVKSEFRILDAILFQSFITDLIQNAEMRWILSSRMEISMNWLPLLKLKSTRFKKAIVVPALNQLKNQRIIEFKLPSDDGQSIKLTAIIEIQNDSRIGIALGKASFKILFKGVVIGFIWTESLDLNPGENIVRFQGELVKAADTVLLSEFFSAYMQGKHTQVEIHGDYAYPETYKEDFHIVPWLDRAFKDLKNTIALPGLVNFSPIQKIEIEELSMDLSEPLSSSNGDTFAILTAFHVSYRLPFGFSVLFKGLAQNLIIYDNIDDESETFFPITQLLYALEPVTTNPEDECISATLEGSMKVLDKPRFSEFLKKVLWSDQIHCNVEGLALADIELSIGLITLDGLQVANSLTLSGMNRFAYPPAKIQDINIYDTTNDSVLVKIILVLFNKSIFSGKFGQVAVDIYYDNFNFVGTAVIDQFSLNKGEVPLEANASLTFKSEAMKTEFFSKYMRGDSLSLKMENFQSSVPMFQLALKGWDMSLEVPGNAFNFIVSVNLGSPATFLLVPKSTFTVFNPMDATVYLTGLSDFHILFNENEHKIGDEINPEDLTLLATVNSPDLKNPIISAPKSCTEIDNWIPLEMNWDLSVLQKATSRLVLSPNVLYIFIQGKVNLQIGDGFMTSVVYVQSDVPVYFNNWKPQPPYLPSKRTNTRQIRKQS